MKNVLFLLALIASFSSVSHAGSTNPVLFSKINPASGMDINPTVSKIEIYADGKVILTTRTSERGSNAAPVENSRQIFAITKIEEIQNCSNEIEKVGAFAPTPGHSCEDYVGPRYHGLNGKKQFAERYCDKTTQYIDVPCAMSVLKLLNALDTISRY